MKILIKSWISGIRLQNHLKLLKYKLGIITNSNHNKREFYEKYFQSVCLFNRIFFKRSVGTGFKNRCCFKEEAYAKGVLVLWSENLKIDSLEILKDSKIKRIAMANPKLAPYGKASMEVLDHLKLTPSLKSKIVYGASISQAHQFVATKNAQIGFGALSLMDKKDKNLSYFIIDKALYSPIEQVLITTKNGANNPLAKVFKDFLFSPKARAIFKEYGYIVD